MCAAVPCEYSLFLDSARTLQQGQAGIARTALCSVIGKTYTTVYSLHSLPAGLSCSQRKNNHSVTRHVPFSQLLQIKQQRERQINSPYGRTRYKRHNLQQVYIKAYKKFL